MWLERGSQALDTACPPLGAIGVAPVAARIGIVLHDFSGGGTERVAIRLANAWAASGRSVTLFCGTETGPARAFVGAHVSVVRATRECVRGLGSRMVLGRALARFASERPQDAVFAPGNFHIPVLAGLAGAGASGATIICKLSNPLRLRGQNALAQAVHDRALRHLARGIDCFVAMSPALRDEARTALARDDIALAWEPILDEDALGRTDQVPALERPLIVAAGRLEEQKNFKLALDAFARSERAQDAQLLILGEGSKRDALARHARRLGIADRVLMPGYSSTIMADLRRASAFLLTSRFEGYPAVLVEAIAAGAPVIATPCSPAIAEIVGGCPASAVVPADAADLAAAIDAALRGGRPSRHGRTPFLVTRHAVDEAASAYLHVLDAARTRARFRQARGLA